MECVVPKKCYPAMWVYKMCDIAFAKILREPKHGFDVIVYGNDRQAELLVRIAATLAVQGIMCRAVMSSNGQDEDSVLLSEALPLSARKRTVQIADDLSLPYSDLPLRFPGRIIGQLKTDASQIALFLAGIAR